MTQARFQNVTDTFANWARGNSAVNGFIKT